MPEIRATEVAPTHEEKINYSFLYAKSDRYCLMVIGNYLVFEIW
jgi:hypothetical protein